MFFAIKNNKLKRIMTFQYFVLNVENGHFIYTNAGHNYPIIVDSNTNKATFINYTSSPLGINSICKCENKEFDLDKGQSLVLYTNGLVNEKNINGEPYGYERFLENLPIHYDINPETFYNNIYNKVYKQWTLKSEKDLTLIFINRK